MRGWRNSRIEGYQGESRRSRSQRHSASFFNATQTGRPSAPARCAIEVSQVTTRSTCAMTAAASRKASGPASKSSPSDSTGNESDAASSCSTPNPFCNEIRRTPGALASGARRSSGKERAMSASGLGLPCQTTPILNPSSPMRRAQRRRRSGSAKR